jgi:hypothetical protein
MKIGMPVECLVSVGEISPVPWRITSWRIWSESCIGGCKMGSQFLGDNVFVSEHITSCNFLPVGPHGI